MNILILHSTQSIIIKKLIQQFYSNDKVYVMTFCKNKGAFSEEAEEVFFDIQNQRINSIDNMKDVQKAIDEKKIDCLVGVCGNINGNGYENLRIILTSLVGCKKVMYNKNLDVIDYTENQNDSLVEFFNKNEYEILPFISRKLIEYRRNNRRNIKNVEKIIFVFDCCSINGTTSLIYYWAKRLNEKYNVICVFQNDGDMYNKFLADSIRTYICNKENYDENATLDFYFSLNNILFQENVDLIVIAGNNTIVPCTIAAVKNNVPLIYKMNNGKFLEIMDNRPTEFELKEMSHLYDSIIPVSNYVKANIEQMGIRGNINTIYGSNINIEDINRCKYEKCKELETTKLNITCISRLSPEKGVDIFLKAISVLDEDTLNKCNFIVAGDGTEKARLLNMIRELNISNYINILGYRNDVFSIIKSSYLTVQPSRREGLGLSILETMSMSKICIASNVGGIPEIIKHNYNGFMFESEDYTELARLIKYCVNNEEIVKNLEVNAFKTIEEKFDINVVINKFCRLFDSKEKA